MTQQLDNQSVELTKEEQESLKQARLVRQLVNSLGFKKVLRPYLEAKIKHTWLDPRKVKDNEEFWYEYVVAWGFSQASDEILKFVDEMVLQANHLEAKAEGKQVDNFRIGGDL